MKQIDEQTIRRIANQMYLMGYHKSEIEQFLDKRLIPEEIAQEIIVSTFKKTINQVEKNNINRVTASSILFKAIGGVALGLIPLIYGLSSLGSNSPTIWIGGLIFGASLFIFGILNINGGIWLRNVKALKKKDISLLAEDCEGCSSTGMTTIFGVKESVPCEGCGGLGMM